MTPAVVYREYAPAEALRQAVAAFFTFTPGDASRSPDHTLKREILLAPEDPFCSPVFADGHASIVFNFSNVYRGGGVWSRVAGDPPSEVIGPLTAVGPPSTGERREMIGAYLTAAGAAAIHGCSPGELTDRTVAVEDVWGEPGRHVAAQVAEAEGSGARIACLESALLRRIPDRPPTSESIDIAALARWIVERGGRISVAQLAAAAGVSRQYLTRRFRERTGLTPQLYGRLARFHAGLAYTGRSETGNWAGLAAELGYADQSHMIAEFRRFSSLTPERLASRRWFHPFIERARARRRHADAPSAAARQGRR